MMAADSNMSTRASTSRQILKSSSSSSSSSAASDSDVQIVDEVEPSEVVWEVKRVLDKRTNIATGGDEYLIEWQNWEGEPTWEPAENCNCRALINKFERSRLKDADEFPEYDKYHEKLRKRKLKLKEIIGVINHSTGLLFIVMWHGLREPEKVPLQVLRRFYAQQIIDYFLDKLKWTSSE